MRKAKKQQTNTTTEVKVEVSEPEWSPVKSETRDLCVILGWNIHWYDGNPAVLRCWYDWSEDCWLSAELDIQEMQPTLYQKMPCPPLTEAEVAARLRVIESADGIDFTTISGEDFDRWLESLPTEDFVQVVTMSDEVNRNGFARL